MPNGSIGTSSGLRERFKLLRDRRDLIAVAHPNFHLLGQAIKENVVVGDFALSAAVFATWRIVDLSPQSFAGQLHAVANAQHGDAEFKQLRIAFGRAVFVDTVRSARKNDAFGRQFGDSFSRDVVSQYLAVNILLAHTPSNQLCVLRSKVQDNDSLAG